jgi:hypothetical protein
LTAVAGACLAAAGPALFPSATPDSAKADSPTARRKTISRTRS